MFDKIKLDELLVAFGTETNFKYTLKETTFENNPLTQAALMQHINWGWLDTTVDNPTRGFGLL